MKEHVTKEELVELLKDYETFMQAREFGMHDINNNRKRLQERLEHLTEINEKDCIHGLSTKTVHFPLRKIDRFPSEYYLDTGMGDNT
jgi:hypothetical protein